jgi:hypothetical protein
MQAKNVRMDNQDQCCIGDFSCNGFQLCQVLEPPYGYQNDINRQAIEPGLYKIVPHWSNDLQCIVAWLTFNITTNTDVSSHYYYIHWGNSHTDTLDCSLLGIGGAKEDWVSNSQASFKNFMERYFLPVNMIACIELFMDKTNLNTMASWELQVLHQLTPQSSEDCTYEIINNFPS